MTTQQHLGTLKKLCEQLTSKRESFLEIDGIIELEKQFTEKLARFKADEQQLNIAIMGQVKAGKSSFVNALLFDGQPVLPAAATPKTANLTRISFGETYALEIEYYSEQEWSDLEKLAKTDGQYDTAKVARELVMMVESSGVNALQVIHEYTQPKEENQEQRSTQRIEKNTLDELMNVLNEYAGNDGKFTPLVKMTRLFLPIEELKGFDVIDTPGMNDPVQSRTQKTKEEMARCDVVFFLSRCDQFLDQSDMDLLGNQLPQGGVKRMILVAGQYDSAILSDGWNQKSLVATEANLNTRFTRRAETEMNKLADQRAQAKRDENADQIRHLTKPVLSSTYAHGFAEWPEQQWSKSMTHIHNELTEMACDEWNDYQITQEDWRRIGNFGALRDAFTQAKAEKQIIIQEQRDGILPDARQALADKLVVLNEAVQQRINALNTKDITELKQQEKICESRIGRIEGKLQDLIGQQISQIKTSRREITQDLQKSIKQFDQLKTRTGTETKEESYSVSTSKWYNPFSWGSSSTHYRTVSVNYEYLSASDAVEQLNQYAHNCTFDIQQHFNALINPNKLKNDLKKVLLDELDTRSTDFDPVLFRSTLNNALDNFELPKLQMSIGNTAQLISQNFSGEQRSSDKMQQLQEKFNQALHQVFQMLSEQFEKATQVLTANITNTQNTLADDLTKSVQAELAKVIEDFAHKGQALKEYEELLGIINSVPSHSAAVMILEPA